MERTRRRHIAGWMLLISMWMLVVAVVPHHHHSFCESVCLRHDMPAECTHATHDHGDAAHEDTDCMHHGDANDDLCRTTCVTNLRTLTPQRALDHLTPDYSYFNDIYLWVEQTFILSQEIGEGRGCYTCYRERLHASWQGRTYNRRGPPAVMNS